VSLPILLSNAFQSSASGTRSLSLIHPQAPRCLLMYPTYYGAYIELIKSNAGNSYTLQCAVDLPVSPLSSVYSSPFACFHLPILWLVGLLPPISPCPHSHCCKEYCKDIANEKKEDLCRPRPHQAGVSR
jgi:hypothetical protein